MKFLVFSDTHGDIRTAMAMAVGREKPDLLIHLGDHQRDGEKMGAELGIPVIALKGNVDGSFFHGEHRIIETDGGNILLTHGHVEAVKSGCLNLLYKAKELGCRAAFFGHTHVPLCVEEDGVLLLNPGSLTLPAGGRPGSFAVAEADRQGIRGEILYVDEKRKEPAGDKVKQPPKTASAEKVDPGRNWDAEGGSIRNLLNNSDRF